jgi:hypothetical protein
MKTAMGDEFTSWIPIYLTEEHYQKAKKLITD